MSLYTYVDTPNSNLVCCICRTPFAEPTTTLTCTHTFCRECILRALSHAPLCPVDRSPLSKEDLGPADPIVRSLVEELEVECVHHASGCKHTCQRQLLHAHLRDECMYGQVKCEEAECGMIVVRCQLNTHREREHGLNEESENGKGEGLQTNSNDEPVESTSKLKAVERPSNLAIESGDHQQKTIDLLTEQNMLLRHRVEVLESTMQVMKKEMGSVRSVLGPWFRTPSGLNTTGTHNQILSESPSQSQLHPTRLRATQRTEEDRSLFPVGGVMGAGTILYDGAVGNNHVATSSYEAASSSSAMGSGGANVNITNTAPSSGHGHQQGVSQAIHVVQGSGHRPSLPLLGEVTGNDGDGIGRVDSLAGYFPTLGDFGVGGPMPQQQVQFGPPGAFMQQQQQQPGIGSVGVGGGPGGLQMNPQAVTRVAPLDLGTNLVGTLEGLRESVVGVAAGIDSLGRRSEIALANESLRLGEEVVSMRAAVHGLRMQIHAMMMERNAQVTGREEGVNVGSSWMAGGGMLGAQGASASSPPVPLRMYSYGGPANITKL